MHRIVDEGDVGIRIVGVREIRERCGAKDNFQVLRQLPGVLRGGVFPAGALLATVVEFLDRAVRPVLRDLIGVAIGCST